MEKKNIVLEVLYDKVFVLKNDEVIECVLMKNIPSVFPGDAVLLDEQNFIYEVLSRKNLLCREKVDRSRLNSVGNRAIIAANIDMACIVVSSTSPPFHPNFIDRYHIVLERSNIPHLLVFNKCEMKTEKEEKILEQYRNLGMPVIETSVSLNIGIDRLREEIHHKQVIFVGPSGVGKSSLTKALFHNDAIRIGNLGEKSKRGCHTTTSSKYYCWEENSGIIDTPGIKSLDIGELFFDELSSYFVEIYEAGRQCKYRNCLHDRESKEICFVKQSVEKELISKTRYKSYLKILRELLQKKYNSFL